MAVPSNDAYERRLQREIRQLRTAVRSLTERALLAADDLRHLSQQSPPTMGTLLGIVDSLERTSRLARIEHLGEEDRPREREALLRRLRAGQGALTGFDRKDPA